MKFKPGQEVVCIAPRSGWKALDFYLKPIYTGFWPFRKQQPMHGPDVNELVTVVGYVVPGAIVLEEYPGMAYLDKFFEPVTDISEVYEVLEKKPFEV